MRRSLLVAVLLVSVVSFTGLGSRGLWTPDEPRDAAIGLSMARSGDFVVPRLSGEPFLEKPPLYWWVAALSFRALGPGDFSARVPSAIFGALTLLVAFAFGTRLGGPRAGLVATAVLATTAEFNETMHRAIVDPALVFFTALAHLGIALACASRSTRERYLGCALAALAVPLAFLSKGVVGPVLALAPPLLYLVAGRRWRVLARLLPIAPAALLLFVVLVLPWIVALEREVGWEGVRECLVVNTLGRVADSADTHGFGHHRPPWYYLAMAGGNLFPWVFALPAAIASGSLRREREDDVRPLPLAGFLIGTLLLSVPSTKRALYLVPLLPGLAAALGTWLGRVFEAERNEPCSARAALHLLLCDVRAVVALPLAPLAPLARAFPEAAVPRGIGAAARWVERSLRRAAHPLFLRMRCRSTVVLLDAAFAVGATGAGAAALLLRFVHLDRLGKGHAMLPVGPIRERLDTPLLAALIAGSLAASLVLLVHVARVLRGTAKLRAEVTLVPLLAAFVAFQTAGKALFDPLKSAHPVTAAIARLVPPGEQLVAYKPVETFRGIVEFDLARSLRGVEDVAALEGAIRERASGYVVYEKRDERDFPDIASNRLEPLWSDVGTAILPHVIARWHPPAR